MTRELVFRPQAEAELLEARSWYEARGTELGVEFGAEVDAAVARIVESPLAFPRVRGETSSLATWRRRLHAVLDRVS